MGRSWTDRGNVIRFNYFHDIFALSGGKKVNAIYLDDQESGFVIHGNIFDRVYRAIQLGGGRDNIITNNIYKDTTIDLYIDGRGIGSTVIGSPQYQQLLTMPYTTMPWSTRYPRLVNILKENPGQPLGNIVEHNIFLNPRKLLIYPEAKEFIEFKNNFEEDAPNFNTVMQPNFQVDPKSKSLELGFTQIPFHEIGKY